MINRGERRGLSPVIATVLLITLALVLALIIFFWARGLINENIIKFGEPAENSCDNIVFDAEADSENGKIRVVNRGNVPLYGIEVRNLNEGSISEGEFFEMVVGVGETGKVEVKLTDLGEILVVPVILGEQDEERVQHVCDDQGIEVSVS